MKIRSLVLVLSHFEEGCDFNSFYAGMRMHLKALLIYWWCHIMYTWAQCADRRAEFAAKCVL